MSGFKRQNYVIKTAIANIAASQTDASIVAAVAGKSIRVLGIFCLAGATATNLTFNTKPSGAGTAIYPLIANAANGGAAPPIIPYEYADQVGLMQTNQGEGLSVTTGSGSATGIWVMYILV